MKCSAWLRSDEPLTIVKDGTTCRRRLPWLSIRCTEYGSAGGGFKYAEPRRECPHGCLDQDPYLCMTCQGSGYVVIYASTCTASGDVRIGGTR